MKKVSGERSTYKALETPSFCVVNATDRTVQEEKDYYDDLSMEFELADDEAPVLYKMGEAFFHLSLPAAKRQLRVDLKRYEVDIDALQGRAGECEKGMKELKVQLFVLSGSPHRRQANRAEWTGMPSLGNRSTSRPTRIERSPAVKTETISYKSI